MRLHVNLLAVDHSEVASDENRFTNRLIADFQLETAKCKTNLHYLRLYNGSLKGGHRGSSEVAHPLGYKKDALSVKIKRPIIMEACLAWRIPQTSLYNLSQRYE